MTTIPQAYAQSSQSRKLNVDREGLYLGLACTALCVFAIALSLKFPSITEALAILS